jgi:hypothetical protein
MRTEIIKCDRCGKELSNEVYKVNLPYMTGDIMGYNSKGLEVLFQANRRYIADLVPRDLCRDCIVDLARFMGREKIDELL